MDPITINVQINVGVTPALENLLTRLLPGQATQTPNAPTAPVQQPEEAPAEIIEDAPADLFPLPGEETPAAPVQQPEAAAPAQEAKEYTEVDVRAAKDRTRRRIEGENYKENTDSPEYKKYHRQLTAIFKQIAGLLGHDKPSQLPTSDLRASFIKSCDELIVKDGEIESTVPF